MPRTITVKGEGKATAKPDQVVLSMSLESRDKEYDKAMEQAAQQIQQLKDALGSVGFEKNDVKTTDFNARAQYDHIRDEDGNFHAEFTGYLVSHSLKLKFDLEKENLSQALSAIAGCPALPQVSLAFTVKDATAINEEMLRSAAANARRKAELLCESSGVKLGQLLAIDYNWGEINVTSDTKYGVEEPYACLMAVFQRPAFTDMEPEDIEVSDTVAFVWEILS